MKSSWRWAIPISFFVTYSSLAEELSVCKEFLSDTLVSRSDTQFISRIAREDHNFICKLSKDRYEGADKRQSSGGLSYPPFSASLSQGSNRSEFREAIDQMCAKDISIYVKEVSYQNTITDGNSVENVVTKCLELAARQDSHLITGTVSQSTEVTTRFSKRHFNVHISNQSDTSNARRYKITNIEPPKAVKCTKSYEDIIANNSNFSCALNRRLSDQEPEVVFSMREVNQAGQFIDEFSAQVRSVKANFTSREIQKAREQVVRDEYEVLLADLMDKTNKAQWHADVANDKIWNDIVGRIPRWVEKRIRALEDNVHVGGMFQIVDGNHRIQNGQVDNPVTNGVNCPDGFGNAVPIGRILVGENPAADNRPNSQRGPQFRGYHGAQIMLCFKSGMPRIDRPEVNRPAISWPGLKVGSSEES